jgi:hypothetical protein
MAAALFVAACGEGETPAPRDRATTVDTRGGRHVDTAPPTFSNPTRITNPLFPISALTQVVQVGSEGDFASRNEITLLPDTRVIVWDGKRVETAMSQFVGYSDGRLLEVATDYFAQADDGSVWYFGEDVDNYEDGEIADHEGTWLAGRDGPPGMIMPARPRVGDRYRPENIPKLVFEEVTVLAVDNTVDGPRGKVYGAITVEERLQDGTREQKVFAPGYGEFEATVKTEDEHVKVAISTPTDAVDGQPPRELATLTGGAHDVFDAVATQAWNRVVTQVDAMQVAWRTLDKETVAPLLRAGFEAALRSLEQAAGGHDAPATRQAATDVEYAALDLQLPYASPADIDRQRVQVWQRQLALDRNAGDRVAVAGDEATLRTIRARISG